ncbi:integrase family protein [Burkholderia sp. H160]|nr:integrase family protein [Burkholderia sp. H160]
MPTARFTAPRIAAFACPPERDQLLLWDTEVKQLGLRATRHGVKRFVFQTKFGTRDIRTTIGSPADWDIPHAREEARRLQRLVDTGIDPREKKRETLAVQAAATEARRTAARREAATVGDAWTSYLKYQKDRQRRGVERAWGERHLLDHVRLAAPGGEKKKRGRGHTEPGPLAPLLPLRLVELDAGRLARWLHTEAGHRPTVTARAFRCLRAFLTWCEDTEKWRDLVPSGVCQAAEIREAVPAAKTKAGDCLQREQLAAWFGAVRRLGNPVVAAYLQALLLTGARREELGALRWDEVDFQWDSLRVADKIEGTRTVPLTPYVSSLLAALPRRNAWVFSSTAAKDGRLVEPRDAHVRALHDAGLPHVSLHGLRRSFGTLAEWCEVPVGVVAQIQGHKPSALAEKHYRRRPLDLLRQWHAKIEAWMLAEAGVEFTPVKPGVHAVK